MKKKSGLAHSPLFAEPGQEITIHHAKPSVRDTSPPLKNVTDNKSSNVDDATVTPRYRDTTIPSNHDTMPPSNHDTVIPRHHDTIEQVRNAVRTFGTEAATHRFTVKEKRAVAELIYSYKQKGIKTSENEIVRIALNYLLVDYRESGEKSILAEALRMAKK
jgi:Ulp1 family protease